MLWSKDRVLALRDPSDMPRSLAATLSVGLNFSGPRKKYALGFFPLQTGHSRRDHSRALKPYRTNSLEKAVLLLKAKAEGGELGFSS